MYGFFGKKIVDTPPTNVDEAKRLLAALGPAHAGQIIRTAAMSGNVFCQIFLAQGALYIPKEKRTQSIQSDFENFTKMAAESGDAGSQHNLGKIYMSKVRSDAEFLSEDDIENIRTAKVWYGKAAAQNLPEAKASLKNLEVFEF